MSIDIDILQQFFAAINRNDVEAACQDLAPDVVRVEPPGFPTSGTYRGIAAFKQQFVTGRGQWAEGACTPEQFLQNGNKIVAYVHVLVRLQGASDWGRRTHSRRIHHPRGQDRRVHNVPRTIRGPALGRHSNSSSAIVLAQER